MPSCKGYRNRVHGFILRKPEGDKKHRDFVRVYCLPKIVLKAGIRSFPAKVRYYRQRSIERYRKDPDQARLMDDLVRAMQEGEIGRIEGFRFITTT